MDVLKVLAVSFMLHPHCGPMKGQPVAMEDEAVRIVTSKGVTFLRCPDGRTIWMPLSNSVGREHVVAEQSQSNTKPIVTNCFSFSTHGERAVTWPPDANGNCEEPSPTAVWASRGIHFVVLPPIEFTPAEMGPPLCYIHGRLFPAVNDKCSFTDRSTGKLKWLDGSDVP